MSNITSGSLLQLLPSLPALASLPMDYIICMPSKPFLPKLLLVIVFS